MKNIKVDTIIESLQESRNIKINEAVINPDLLDRFIKYCKASNVKDISPVKMGSRYFIVGISDKRFRALRDSFVKANNYKITFEYNLDGTTEILRLETDTSV